MSELWNDGGTTAEPALSWTQANRCGKLDDRGQTIVDNRHETMMRLGSKMLFERMMQELRA